MNSSAPLLHQRSRAHGVTLIELLISVAIGLVIMGGAIGIFISSKQAYKTEDAMSRNQEAGRFAMEMLAKNIRAAGYAGCSNLEDISPNVIADPPPSNGFAINTAIIGFEGESTSAKNKQGTWVNPSPIPWVTGTDVLIIATGGECGADLTGNMGVTNANIQVANAASCGFVAGDALMITDCHTADVFRASSVSESTGKITVAHANNVNTTQFLSRAYEEGATVLKFLQYAYFIGTSPNGNPALYRVDVNGNSQELIENIQDMQIVYGVDNGEDGIVDRYLAADSVDEWKSALSVELRLLVRSDNNALTTPQVIAFNGANINGGIDTDHRLRNAFKSTVSVRNRLP